MYRCMHDANPLEWSKVMEDSLEAFFGLATTPTHSDPFGGEPSEPSGPAGENIYYNVPPGSMT